MTRRGLSGPVKGPFVWTGAELQGAADWIYHWTPAALAEVDAVAAEIARTGAKLETIEPGDYPLTAFTAELDSMRENLRSGRGLVWLRGLPIERYTQDQVEMIYWVLGAALGTGLSQSYKGDRLGHVVDIGEPGRYYTVGGALEMHMDPVDVVGLLCLKKAVKGGESRISSSSLVHNIVAAERPDLLPLLYEGFRYASRRVDRRADSPAYTDHRVPVFAEIAGMPDCFLLPIAARASESEGAAMTAAEHEALRYLNEVAQRPEVYAEMDLVRGDIQFLNNRLILHGRADYTDAPDPAEKRHMLRLWLAMPGWPQRPADMEFHTDHEGAVGAAAR